MVAGLCSMITKWLRYCNVGRSGIIDLITIMVVVGYIMREGLDGTSENGRWFTIGRQIVYAERIFGIGGVPSFSLYLFTCIGKQQITSEQLQWLACLDISIHTFSAHVWVLITPDCHLNYINPTLRIVLECIPTYCT